MRQLQNDLEKIGSFYQNHAQIYRLTVHLLMDLLITNPPRELGPLRKRGRANASLLGLR